MHVKESDLVLFKHDHVIKLMKLHKIQTILLCSNVLEEQKRKAAISKVLKKSQIKRFAGNSWVPLSRVSKNVQKQKLTCNLSLMVQELGAL